MGLAALVTLLGAVAAGVAGVVRMAANETLGGDFPEVIAVIAFPFALSAMGVWSVLSKSKRLMWVMAGLSLVYIVLTMFSVGPYFWFWAGGNVLAAVLLQLTSARRGANAADGGISSVRG